MFSLVIVIISIALVGIAALATLYYGGDMFNQGAEKAAIARSLSEGTQVQGAMEVYRAQNNGQLPTGTSAEIIAKMVDGGYLKSWPDASWELRNDYAVRTGLTTKRCEEINAKLGVTGIPQCTDTLALKQSLCCSTP